MMTTTFTPILKADHLTKIYSDRPTPALSDVSLTIGKGECVGIVGESGSGKSTLARCLLRLESLDQGTIEFRQQLYHSLKGHSLRQARQHIGAVFQHPTAALNPKLTIIDSLMEPLDLQPSLRPSFVSPTIRNREQIATQLLEYVQLPTKLLSAYPHELSGGQKQRVTIARAISTEPDLIILDEPTASLDVTSQAAVLKLLQELQQSLHLSYLFISHDLAAVYQMSDRILVMRHGQIVDQFASNDLYHEERHEYTASLLDVFLA